jgi:hypothetical protein
MPTADGTVIMLVRMIFSGHGATGVINNSHQLLRAAGRPNMTLAYQQTVVVDVTCCK